jgi:hypothetical protein
MVAPVARTEYFPTFGDAYELHVELRGIRPKIWRSLQVPLEYSLDELHDVLQIAFGWQNSHLHDFEVNGIRFGMVDVEDEIFAVDERAAPLGALATPGSKFLYRYDFGDDWEHDIVVVGVVEDNRNARLSPPLLCTGGARACPPEDSGGTHGYAQNLKILADPDHEEYADTKTWVGRCYDPEKFNLTAVNKKLATLARKLERRHSRP